MKLNKKLMLSIITVFFAFVSLITSTYAWFTISQAVTVSGLSLRVTTEDSLLIAHKDTEPEAADWNNSYHYDLSTMKFHPTSTVDLEHWFKANAASADAYGPVAVDDGEDVYSTVSTTDEDFDSYVFYDGDLWIKYVGETDTRDLYLSEITLELPTEGVTDIYKSVRIGVKFNDDFYIYATNTATTNNKGVNSATTTATITNWALVEATDRTDVFTTLTKNTAINIELFVWFEGEDSNNYTNNINISPCNMSFKFSIEERA